MVTRIHISNVSALLILAIMSSAAHALSLQQAEQIALQQDPLVASLEADAKALQQTSIASDTLPDPQLRLGLFNLPTDSLDLDQEPTTQLRLGVQQRFPRGDSQQITAKHQQLQSQAVQHRADNARLELLRDLRISYLNLYYEIQAAQIVNNSRDLFSQLVNITEDRYAAGRANQQDVLNASVQLTRLDDRYTKILGMQDQHRARLALWLGNAASQELDSNFPELAKQNNTEAESLLLVHPEILAQQLEYDAEKSMVDMAKQDYSPGLNAVFEYRKRFGDNPDGSERTDMLAAMVTMDIPLFTEDRQDRKVAARNDKVTAARYKLDDKLRKLKLMLETNQSAYLRAEQRENIYQQRLLADAGSNASAALNAYQSGVSDFTALMRAQITELDVRLDALRVRIDKAIAQARLLYLNGESS